MKKQTNSLKRKKDEKMTKRENIALCLYCKRKVEKYSDLMILALAENDNIPCAYCNSYDEVDIYSVTRKNLKAKEEIQTNICKVCLSCHKTLSKRAKTTTELIEWHGKNCECDMCNTTGTGGTYKITKTI